MDISIIVNISFNYRSCFVRGHLWKARPPFDNNGTFCLSLVRKPIAPRRTLSAMTAPTQTQTHRFVNRKRHIRLS